MIRTEIRDGAGWIWLARPEKKNAFDGAMLAAIADHVTAWSANSDVRAIVLGADGETFCAGADLNWMAAEAMAEGDGNRDSARKLGRVFHTIAESKKPVIARVQGAARGGGVGLVAACDIAILSENASFALTEVRLGLVPAVISPFVIERLGPSQARALFMTGDAIDAVQAHRLGLGHRLCAADQLDATVAQVLASLIKGGPEALVACKQLVARVAFADKREVFEDTVDLIAQRRASAEAAEGMAAFLQRRTPNWIPKN